MPYVNTKPGKCMWWCNENERKSDKERKSEIQTESKCQRLCIFVIQSWWWNKFMNMIEKLNFLKYIKGKENNSRAKLLTFIAVLSWTVCNHVMVRGEGTEEETSWQIDLHSPDFPSYCLIWTKLYWQLVAVGIERQILLPRLTICFNSITPIPISSHQE